MKTLELNLGKRSYPIHIGSGLLAHQELLAPHIGGNRVAIVSNVTVAPLYLDQVTALLSDYRPETIVLPDGEQYKNWEVLNQIFGHLINARCDRKLTLIALGGGVIGDMTGFAAACYQRGVPFIQIPTTLLAQVDSSVGGKTGINHPQGKNMIGAFYQPRCVLIDTDTLTTLPDNEISAGLAEVIKYGFIHDVGFIDWLEQNMDALRSRVSDALTYAIFHSCRYKAEIVEVDERETGPRALLNLGHTFGHAIETGTGYGSWLHGEAVAVGMVMAADLSYRMGWIPKKDFVRVETLVRQTGLPVRPPQDISVDQFLSLMAVDKKVENGQMRLVLLRALGHAEITADINPRQLRETLAMASDTAINGGKGVIA